MKLGVKMGYETFSKKDHHMIKYLLLNEKPSNTIIFYIKNFSILDFTSKWSLMDEIYQYIIEKKKHKIINFFYNLFNKKNIELQNRFFFEFGL